MNKLKQKAIEYLNEKEWNGTLFDHLGRNGVGVYVHYPDVMAMLDIVIEGGKIESRGCNKFPWSKRGSKVHSKRDSC